MEYSVSYYTAQQTLGENWTSFTQWILQPVLLGKYQGKILSGVSQ